MFFNNRHQTNDIYCSTIYGNVSIVVSVLLYPPHI